MYNAMTHYYNFKSRLYWLCHGSWCWVLSSGDVCISATTGPGMSSDTCFPDSQTCLTPISSDFNALFTTIARLVNHSNIHRPLSPSRTFATLCMCYQSQSPVQCTYIALSIVRYLLLTTSRTDSPAVRMTTQNYLQNTVDATMVLDKSLNVQPDSDVHA